MARALTTVASPMVQRKCACGGPARGAGECTDCARKKLAVQRAATPGERAIAAAPPGVCRVLASAGQSLEPATQRTMEGRFGHSFAHVRVHTGPDADASARALDAHAYTVDRHVVFRRGEYAPGTTKGQRLLAHELAHVVQQSGAGRSSDGPLDVAPVNHPAERAADQAAAAVTSGGSASRRPLPRASRALHRQPAGDEERRPPEAGVPAAAPRLHLDPSLEAEALAIRARALLDPALMRTTLLRLDVDSLISAPPPTWATPVPATDPPPLVPRGAGPDTPRPAGTGDLLKAVAKVPAIDSALTGLQLEAERQVRVGWGGLSGGERALVVTQSALLGGGAVAGILSQPGTRQFALDVLQNRLLPTGIPGLQFQFNLTGPDQRIDFRLNVGALLPRSLGFR